MQINNIVKTLLLIVILLSFTIVSPPLAGAAENPVVVMKTSKGNITIELFEKEAPVTVKNFLDYVDSGFYDNLIFHRVISGFMIQGGGFNVKMKEKNTKAPIKNEAKKSLPNSRGTIAMARTGVVDSATSQFFINLVDNVFLNHKNNSHRGFGYAVFGKVTNGMDVVDDIGNVRTRPKRGMKDVPARPIIINSARLVVPPSHPLPPSGITVH
ncbi:MAG: peptidylprolyl isomerase [Thermodesulfobacteriota bacterium]